MAIFDFIRAGSGAPVLYGGVTIGVHDPRVSNPFYNPPDRTITVIPPSGGNNAYFALLDSRYHNRPSGWSH